MLHAIHLPTLGLSPFRCDGEQQSQGRTARGATGRSTDGVLWMSLNFLKEQQTGQLEVA